jgi:hypothetical protein
MDFAATFDRQSPPEDPLPADPEFPVSQSGTHLFDFHIQLIQHVVTHWWTNSHLILADESEYVKYSVIAVSLQILATFQPTSLPFLIVTASSATLKWTAAFTEWSSLTALVFGNAKPAPGAADVAFTPESPRNFDVLVVSREQFVRYFSSLPQLNWGAVFIDDFAQPRATYAQSLVGLSEVRRSYLAFLCQDFSAINSGDVQAIADILQCPDVSTFVISVDLRTLVDAPFIEERLFLCPMASPQAKLCQATFVANRDKLMTVTADDRYAKYLCELLRQLRYAATHPALTESPRFSALDNPEPASGKFRELVRIIGAEKRELRKVVIACADMRTVGLLHACFAARGVRHARFEGSTRPKQQEKLAKQFNAVDGFALLILPVHAVVLGGLNADTIVSFDLDWIPAADPEEVVRWYHRAAAFPPRLLRLVSANSIEHVMLDVFWEDRALLPVAVEAGERGAAPVLDCLMMFASLLFREERAVEDQFVASYADRSPLSVRNYQFGPGFWEGVMPRTLKPAKGRSLHAHKYWTEGRLRELVELLGDFGWGRWERFESLARSASEIARVSVVLIRECAGTLRDYPALADALGADFSSPEVERFADSLPLIAERAEGLDGPLFLQTLEALQILSSARPASPEDLRFDGVPIDLPSVNWGADDDRALAWDVWRFGLTKLPDDFRPEIPRDVLAEYAVELLPHLHSHAPPRTVITLRTPRKLTAGDHDKILNAIMSYGYPSLEEFHAHLEVPNIPADALRRYVDNVLLFCDASLEDRKKFVGTFAQKIPKYTAQKIPMRLALFDQIRRSARNFAEFPAEDIEFLSAVAFHGMANSSMSPVLNVACLGSCTETKLYMRIKAQFSTAHHPRLIQRIPENLADKMPLRINDMLMLGSLGVISGRPGFHNELYIYPLGYQCFVVGPAPNPKDPPLWVETTVEERDDRPLFVIKPMRGDAWKYAGETPSAPFEELRARIMRKTKRFVPPIDGHEMFGFTSAFVHRLLMDAPGFELCPGYQRRFFRSTLTFVNEWPTIGHFEPNPERLTQLAQLQSPTMHFKFKKKAFGDVLPPLVLNFAQLYSGDVKAMTVNVRAGIQQFSGLLERYEKWDSDEIARFCGPPGDQP